MGEHCLDIILMIQHRIACLYLRLHLWQLPIILLSVHLHLLCRLQLDSASCSIADSLWTPRALTVTHWHPADCLYHDVHLAVRVEYQSLAEQLISAYQEAARPKITTPSSEEGLLAYQALHVQQGTLLIESSSSSSGSSLDGEAAASQDGGTGSSASTVVEQSPQLLSLLDAELPSPAEQLQPSPVPLQQVVQQQHARIQQQQQEVGATSSQTSSHYSSRLFDHLPAPWSMVSDNDDKSAAGHHEADVLAAAQAAADERFMHLALLLATKAHFVPLTVRQVCTTTARQYVLIQVLNAFVGLSVTLHTLCTVLSSCHGSGADTCLVAGLPAGTCN